MKGHKILLAVSVAFGLSACSVEATSPPIDLGVIAPPSTSVSKSMAVEGNWSSSCNYNSGIYTKETMSFKDNSVSVKVESFYSSSCTGAPIDSQTISGTMVRFGNSFYVSGGHDVEVTFKQPDGTTDVQLVLFLLEGGTLYTSDADDAGGGLWPRSVDRSKPYSFIGG